MSYQSGDRLKNRYLSNDAFTSLKNKLGGRSITSLGNNRRRNSYKIANHGFDLLDYKTLIYRIFISALLIIVCLYIIPQTRYFIHGYSSKVFSADEDVNNSIVVDDSNSYNIAPVFLKTDQFMAKQKENFIDNNVYVYDLFTNNLIGLTVENSSSTINIRLFSDAGFKNNFLIEQDNAVADDVKNSEALPESETPTTSTSTDIGKVEIVKEANRTYQSYVFEGLGYGQMIAKVPPKTEVKKDSFLYVRTIDGLKPIAKIVDVNEDNKSTFTIVYAQLLIPPQNIYKVIFK